MTWTNGLTDANGTPQNTTGASDWDYVVLGGEVCPGVASVRARAPSGLDRQKPKGQKKTFTVDNGDPPVEFDIDIKLQPSDYPEFRDFIIPILRPRSKTGGRAPLSFEHPQALFWNVGTITVDDIETTMPSPGGVMVVKIKAFEWTAEPARVKRGDGNYGEVAPMRVVGDQFNGGLTYELSSLPSSDGQFPQ